MAKVNKLQKYAVQWLHSTGINSIDISKELKLTEDQVLSVLKELQTTNTNNSHAKNLMITHTAGKQINSVAIMTKEASELGDMAKKSQQVNEIKDRNGIFRPKKK